jgi:hypothetical protein
MQTATLKIGGFASMIRCVWRRHHVKSHFPICLRRPWNFDDGAARFGAAPVTPTASVSGVPEAYVAARSRAAAPSCSITLSSPCAYFRYCSAMR